MKSLMEIINKGFGQKKRTTIKKESNNPNDLLN